MTAGSKDKQHHLLEQGEVVADRYKVVRLLGRGTFGEVYHAERQPLGAPVALKVIRKRFTSPGVAERLEREAKVLQRVANAHVLQVHDVGYTADQLPFLVTELLEGATLADEMDQMGDGLGLQRSLDIINQCARGLVPCHEIGVVHRDLKPSNVFLLDGTFVKIIDFGFARAFDKDGERTVAKQITTEGFVGGTPHYMAPEVIRGAVPTPAADIYALGLMLYEMVSGRSPFAPARPLRDLVAELRATPLKWAVLHVKAPRAPLSQAMPHLEADPSLEAVLAGALDVDPAQRWQHAGELSAALAGVMVP